MIRHIRMYLKVARYLLKWAKQCCKYKDNVKRDSHNFKSIFYTLLTSKASFMIITDFVLLKWSINLIFDFRDLIGFLLRTRLELEQLNFTIFRKHQFLKFSPNINHHWAIPNLSVVVICLVVGQFWDIRSQRKVPHHFVWFVWLFVILYCYF